MSLGDTHPFTAVLGTSRGSSRVDVVDWELLLDAATSGRLDEALNALMNSATAPAALGELVAARAFARFAASGSALARVIGLHGPAAATATLAAAGLDSALLADADGVVHLWTDWPDADVDRRIPYGDGEMDTVCGGIEGSWAHMPEGAFAAAAAFGLRSCETCRQQENCMFPSVADELDLNWHYQLLAYTQTQLAHDVDHHLAAHRSRRRAGETTDQLLSGLWADAFGVALRRRALDGCGPVISHALRTSAGNRRSLPSAGAFRQLVRGDLAEAALTARDAATVLLSGSR